MQGRPEILKIFFKNKLNVEIRGIEKHLHTFIHMHTFILSFVIWYELFTKNIFLSTLLQSSKMQMVLFRYCSDKFDEIEYFDKKYRENWYVSF